jgi:hypothetical protein
MIASAGLLVVFVSMEEIVRRLMAARRRRHVVRDIGQARAALRKAVRYGDAGHSSNESSIDATIITNDRCRGLEVWLYRCARPMFPEPDMQKPGTPCTMAVLASESTVLLVT